MTQHQYLKKIFDLEVCAPGWPPGPCEITYTILSAWTFFLGAECSSQQALKGVYDQKA